MCSFFIHYLQKRYSDKCSKGIKEISVHTRFPWNHITATVWNQYLNKHQCTKEHLSSCTLYTSHQNARTWNYTKYCLWSSANNTCTKLYTSHKKKNIYPENIFEYVSLIIVIWATLKLFHWFKPQYWHTQTWLMNSWPICESVRSSHLFANWTITHTLALNNTSRYVSRN